MLVVVVITIMDCIWLCEMHF